MKSAIKLFLVLLLFMGINAMAQKKQPVKFDTLLLTDNTEVKCNVTEVLPDAIKYKKATNPDGPVYTIQKSQLIAVVYKNGEREVFEKIVEEPKKEPDTVVGPKDKKQEAADKRAERIAKYGDSERLVITLGGYTDQPDGYTIPHYYLNCDLPYYRNTDFGIRTFTSGVSSKSSSDAGGIKITADVFALSLGIGGNYYFNRLLKVDKDKMHIYAGLAAMYTSIDTSLSSNSALVASSSDSSTEFDVIFQIGYKYFLGKHFGLNAELDFNDGSAFKVGLSYRFQLKPKK